MLIYDDIKQNLTNPISLFIFYYICEKNGFTDGSFDDIYCQLKKGRVLMHQDNEINQEICTVTHYNHLHKFEPRSFVS